MIFDRQKNIFNPENQKSNIVVIGAGCTGSFTVLNLAKLGFSNITVIDFDKVSIENIPNQFYRVNDVDKEKVEALKEIVMDFTGTEIITINKKIDDDNKFLDTVEINLDTIVVFCLDNIEARKQIYEEIKDMPIKLVDTRMGGEGYQIYTVNLEYDDEKLAYEKLLEGEVAETVCGEKSVIYTILSIASETCNVIKKVDKQEKYPKVIKREMKTYTILGGC